LARQIAKLVGFYSGAEVVGEIGGGLNFQRPRLLALLEQVGVGDVGTIVVAHQARKKNVVVVAYTSKTCTKCGHIHVRWRKGVSLLQVQGDHGIGKAL